ncbi:hypothetical protein ABPG72_022701 [Tetrahymena utriculariae]
MSSYQQIYHQNPSNYHYQLVNQQQAIYKTSPIKNDKCSPCTYFDDSVEQEHFQAQDDYNMDNIQFQNQDCNNYLHNISNLNLENESTALKDENYIDQNVDQENLSLMMESIPVIRELMVLAEADSNGKIQFSNFFKLLKKLKICSSQVEAQQVFIRISGQSYDFCSHEQFFLFFSKELKSLNLTEITTTELLLRLVLEFFRVLGKEKVLLDLRDLMIYSKAHLDLDLDFIQLLEIFEFYDNIYTGVIKKKQSIVQFFQNCAPKLTKFISDRFIYQLEGFLQSQRPKLDTSTALKLKVYDDKEAKSGQKRVINAIDIKQERESIQGLLKKNFNLNFEVAVEENCDKENQVENEIEDYFQENHPKNKGWLQRKSKKHQNKWSNLFFYIYHNNSHLVSIKPTSLKREISCLNIELYKCNFIELLDYQETRKANIERRKLRNKNFMSMTEGDKLNTYNNSNDASKMSNSNFHTQSIARKNELQNFFLFDKSSNKSYLIRSEESITIMSIISFHNKTVALNDKNDKDLNAKLSNFPDYYRQYSGIIEIAMCDKKSINLSYTNFNQFSFKKQYLIIDQGKCKIYNIKQKDKINLMEYEIKLDPKLPHTPLCPYSFMLEKTVKPDQGNAEEEAKKKEEQMQSQHSSVVVFNPSNNTINNENNKMQNKLSYINLGEKSLKNEITTNILSPKVLQYNCQQNNQQQTSKNQQQSSKQGFFFKIFQKIYKKTPDRLIVAADSEYMRKQWIFTINFHKTMLVRMKKKNKSSFCYYQSFNTNQFFSNLNTQENEFHQNLHTLSIHNNLNVNSQLNGSQLSNLTHQQQLALVKNKRQSNRSQFGSGDYKQNSQVQNKNNSKLSEVEGDNDYYDIFAQKDIVEEVKEEDDEHNDDSPKQVFKYNPNDYQNKMHSTQAAPHTQMHQIFYHTRQGSHNQVLNTINSMNNPQYTNIQKQSILKTTEENMYTMSFPQNNPLFKKSLVLFDNNKLIMNSKEIKTFTDEEVWQKFIKHFLVFNHQYSEIDLSTQGTQFGADHLQAAVNNCSYLKSTNHTQPMSKSTPLNKFLNHNQFVFNGVENHYEQGLEQNNQSLEIQNKANIEIQENQFNELQSQRYLQKQKHQSMTGTRFQESSVFEEFEQEHIEPCAQKINFRQIVIHKQF